MKKTLLFIVIAYCCSITAKAQNLILNPSNDDVLVNGEIPQWQEILGTDWKQRCSIPEPLPGNGSCYFFSGEDSLDVLAQTIDVSGYGATIDNGLQTFYFHGYVTSYSQAPADESNIYIEFANSGGSLLSSVHFGPYIKSGVWLELDSALQVPPLTRNVTVRLWTVRHSGTNNDGYYDELYLGPGMWSGISEINPNSFFSIYPNPSSGELTISLREFPNDKTTFTLTDLYGRKLKELVIVSEDTPFELEQPNGIYFATISTGTNIYTTKVVIDR